jgi:hypothetical protein
MRDVQNSFCSCVQGQDFCSHQAALVLFLGVIVASEQSPYSITPEALPKALPLSGKSVRGNCHPVALMFTGQEGTSDGEPRRRPRGGRRAGTSEQASDNRMADGEELPKEDAAADDAYRASSRADTFRNRHVLKDVCDVLFKGAHITGYPRPQMEQDEVAQYVAGYTALVNRMRDPDVSEEIVRLLLDRPKTVAL